MRATWRDARVVGIACALLVLRERWSQLPIRGAGARGGIEDMLAANPPPAIAARRSGGYGRERNSVVSGE